MGTLISHEDKPLRSFFNADRIWDFFENSRRATDQGIVVMMIKTIAANSSGG